jgi:hypothetical protein
MRAAGASGQDESIVKKKLSSQERLRRKEQSLRDKHGVSHKAEDEFQASMAKFDELEAAADSTMEESIAHLPEDEQQIIYTILEARPWASGIWIAPGPFEQYGIEDLDEKRLAYIISTYSAFEPSEVDEDGSVPETVTATALDLLFSKDGGKGGVERICELLDVLQQKITGFKSQCLYIKHGQQFLPFQFNFSFETPAADEVRTSLDGARPQEPATD